MSTQPCGCDVEAGWLCDQHAALLADTGTSPEPNTERLDGKLPKWERLDRAERFKARLAAADQMTDTQPSPVSNWNTANTMPVPSAAEQFRAEAVAVADAVQTREDLMGAITTLKAGLWQARQTRDDLENRIATLEQQNARLQERMALISNDYRYLLDLERHDREQFRERIAAITATFYHAELSISSTQPIIALALELNPDLVERAR